MKLHSLLPPGCLALACGYGQCRRQLSVPAQLLVPPAPAHAREAAPRTPLDTLNALLLHTVLLSSCCCPRIPSLQPPLAPAAC